MPAGQTQISAFVYEGPKGQLEAFAAAHGLKKGHLVEEAEPDYDGEALAKSYLIMYLGQIVEMAAVDALFDNPRHPYTEALISAIPQPMIRKKGDRIVLGGDVPNPEFPPSSFFWLIKERPSM